jgi:hypothetical protein
MITLNSEMLSSNIHQKTMITLIHSKQMIKMMKKRIAIQNKITNSFSRVLTLK